MLQISPKAEKRKHTGQVFVSYLRRRNIRVLILLLILITMFGMAVDSLRRESVTLDEPLHLTAGYAFWSFGDFRLQESHGALPQRWFAIPLLFSEIHFPSRDEPAWRQPGYLGLEVCHKFFYASGNQSDAMVFRGRLMAVAIALLTAVVVYCWAGRVFGRVPALFACFLCAMSPTMLAHGRLMTSDVPAALFFLMSLASIWSLVRRFTWLRLISSVVCFGFVMVSKMSGGLIVPMALLVWLLRMALNRPWYVQLSGLKPFAIRTLLGKAGLAAGTMLVHAFGAIFVIWSFYGWQHNPATDWNPLLDAYTEPRENVFIALGSSRPIFSMLENWKILPDAYLYGLAHTIRHAAERPAFLNGDYSSTGWWYYFPYCFLVKTPLPLLGLVVLGFSSVVAAIVSRKHWRRAVLWVWLDRSSFVWILILGYGLIALFTNLNIGHRHLLPIYPPLFILAGASIRWFTKGGRLLRVLMTILVLTNVSVLAWIHPHYLAYFNVLAGGPSKGYLHLTDSNVDWGQDLPLLSQWLHRNSTAESGEAVYLRYFGFDLPSRWGIQANSFPDVSNPRFSSDYPVAFRPGLFCFSATDFILPGLGKPPWDEAREDEYRRLLLKFRDFEQTLSIPDGQEARRQWERIAVDIAVHQWHRLRSFLWTRTPDAMPGYSILVFRLSENELQKALLPENENYR